jgi:glycosyltransferase involved in cell wall biosynthesis
MENSDCGRYASRRVSHPLPAADLQATNVTSSNPGQPLRVLHVASGDLWAGAEVQLFHLLCSLRRRTEVTVEAAILNPGKLADRLREQGIPVSLFDERRMSSVAIGKALVRIARTRDVQVIHTHRTKENILGTIAALCSPYGVALRTAHGRPEHGIGRFGKRLILNVADRLAARFQRATIGVSAELCGYLRQAFPGRPVYHIPNGIDPDLVRQEALLPCSYPRSDAFTVGFLGRLVPVKRVDVFLEMARVLCTRAPGSFRFAVAGDGPLERTLRAKASELGIESAVDFLGFQQNSAALLSRMDCLVLTSDHEGMPMVVLEALALGVPIVAHSVGGLPELLTGSPIGHLVPSQDPAPLAQAIETVAHQAGPRSESRASALPAELDSRQSVLRYIEIYRSIARGPLSQN